MSRLEPAAPPPASPGAPTLRGDLAGGAAAFLVALPPLFAYAPVVFASLGPAALPGAAVSLLAAFAALNAVAALLGGAGFLARAIDGPTALMLGSSLAGLLAAAARAGAPPDPALALGLLALSALLAGLLQAAAGALRLGGVIRHIPLPVVAGLRDGTALLILGAQIRPLLGLPAAASLADPAACLAAADPRALAVAAATAGAILLAGRLRAPLPPPLAGLVAGCAAHALLGAPADPAPAAAPPPGTWFPLAGFASRLLSGDVEPRLLLAVLPVALGLALLSALQSLLAALAASAAHDERPPADRELAALGAGNALSALLGGVTGVILATPSLANRASGGRTRRSLAFAALLSALALPAAPRLAARLPAASLAAVVALLCLALFDRWSLALLAAARRREIPPRAVRADLSLVLLVIAVTLGAGLLTAVATGVLISLVRFVARMSRDVIRRRFGGDAIHSNVHRGVAEFVELVAHGEEIRALELEGALFFGSAERLARELERAPGEGVKRLILDLSRVTEIDSTAVDILAREARILARQGTELLLCGLAGRSGARLLFGARALRERFGDDRMFAGLDDALARAEDLLLDERLGPGRLRREIPPEAFAPLERMTEEEKGGLIPLLARREYAAGAYLARAGDPADRLYFLARGRVDVRFAAADGASRRLAALTPGSLFGEMAALDGRPRSADLIALQPVVCHELPLAALDRLRRERPALAHRLIEGVALELTRRLRISNRIITGLKA